MRRPLPLVLLVLPLGCTDADAEKLRRVGDKTYDRVAHAAQQVVSELEQTLLDQKAPAPQPPTPAPTEDLTHKVQQRLAWDRDLTGLPLQATAAGDTVTLKGTVKTAAQKQRAVELAEKTVGVGKVIADVDVAETGTAATESDEELP